MLMSLFFFFFLFRRFPERDDIDSGMEGNIPHTCKGGRSGCVRVGRVGQKFATVEFYSVRNSKKINSNKARL